MKTHISYHANVYPFEPGMKVTVLSNRWQQCYSIVSVDSPNQMTVRWDWWREQWVKLIGLAALTALLISMV